MADTSTPSPLSMRAKRWLPGLWVLSLLWTGAASAPSRDGTIADLRRTTRGFREGAPTASAPWRNRYKLDSIDKDWQEAQGRREAFYSNLTPGKHRFHLIAANSEGIWNDAGKTVDFVVPPTFVQTAWFSVLCAARAILFVWLTVRFRLRQVAGRMRGFFAERIARELNDTLLQSTQGLVLNFQARPIGSRTTRTERC